jgi:hypothetical protein
MHHHAAVYGFEVLCVEAANVKTRHIWHNKCDYSVLHSIVLADYKHTDGTKPFSELDSNEEIALCVKKVTSVVPDQCRPPSTSRKVNWKQLPITKQSVDTRNYETDNKAVQRNQMELTILKLIKDEFGLEIVAEEPIMHAGLNSMDAVRFSFLLQSTLPEIAPRLPRTLMFEYPTASSIAEYLNPSQSEETDDYETDNKAVQRNQMELTVFKLIKGESGFEYDGQTFAIYRMMESDFEECASQCAKAFVYRNAVVKSSGVSQAEFAATERKSMVACLSSGLSIAPPCNC